MNNGVNETETETGTDLTHARINLQQDSDFCNHHEGARYGVHLFLVFFGLVWVRHQISPLTTTLY